MRCSKLLKSVRWPVAIALVVAATVQTGFSKGLPVIPPDHILSGEARVVDGDTIEIAATRIRLDGIDAPETGQTCQNAAGQTWDCGNAATRLLVSLTHALKVDCQLQSLDKYGRLLAVCSAGGLNLNSEMVKRGYAWAFVRYSRLYVPEEAQARAAKLGIWQGTAVPAWDYRAGRWNGATAEAPQGCAIKGNVSRSGLIYHMPWSPWYQRVAMSPERGTRWFCTEAEALAAGWRPAMAAH